MPRTWLFSSAIVLLLACSDDSGESGSGDSSGETGSDDGGTGATTDSGSGTDDGGSTGNTSSSGGTSTSDTGDSGGTGTGDTGTTNGGTSGDTGTTGDTETGETQTSGETGDTGETETPTGTATTTDTGATTSGALTCGDMNEQQCAGVLACAAVQGQQYVPAANETWCLDATEVFVYCTPSNQPCLPTTQTVCIGDDTYLAWSACELPSGVTECEPPEGYTGPC
jgi:hypothetical protein